MNNLDTNFTYEEAKFLVKNGVIHQGTEVCCNINGRKLYSDVNAVYDDYDKKIMLFKIFYERRYLIISQKNILEIDGMNPHKIYKAYREEDDCITIIEKTDVEKNVLGKKEAILENNSLYNGLKIILKNDVNEKYNEKKFTIKGVGELIEFANQRGRPKKVLA